MMERLTNSIDYCQLHCDFGKSNECFFQDKSKCYEKNIYEKLREYEDLEEQGLLLRLPCKIGDTVYSLDRFCGGSLDCPSRPCKECPDYQLEIYEGKFALKDIPEFGKTIFLPQEESEQKLEEMEDD